MNDILLYLCKHPVISTKYDEVSIVLEFSDGTTRIATSEEILAATKLQKIDKLKVDCTNYMQAGFVSNALGSAHTYDSSLPQDQTNLLGAKLAGIDQQYTCTDSNGYKSRKLHTYAQINQVFIDGMFHVQTAKSHLYDLIVVVNQASTIEAVEAVVW